jgi:hypothetical protein
MFTPSFSNLLVEARVEELHRAARNAGSRRRHPAATALATGLTRTRTWSRQS